MPHQSLQVVVLLCLVATGANAFRKKQKNKDEAKTDAVDVSLRERSGSAQSFVEDKQVSLDEAVVQKGGDDRRRRRRHSKNGHCLPHQKCTYWDCCALGTSCNTCPAGYHGEKAFGRCAWKGHYVCNSRDCTGQWTAWSQCSAQCGGGTRHSFYQYINHASSGGRGCPHHNGQKKNEACNTHACPVNCVGSWGSFGTCSQTCGGGQQSKTFTVTTPAQHGGHACSHQNGATQTQACNAQGCPVDCQGQWGEYGECSATCGAGTQTRTFTVSVPAAHKGAQCSAKNGQTESKPCHLKDCCPEFAGPDQKDPSLCVDQMTELPIDASCCK